jgi:hypothetical protein
MAGIQLRANRLGAAERRKLALARGDLLPALRAIVKASGQRQQPRPQNQRFERDLRAG